MDAGDNDLTRFLTYFVAALQTLALSEVEGIKSDIGQGVLIALHSPGKPNIEDILTALLNDTAKFPHDVALILDDYHVIESPPVNAPTSVDGAINFLLDHLPSQMHLTIATRTDPTLTLARRRDSRQLVELRGADLRFTIGETADFLNQVMGFELSAQDVVALGTRTEGWIAGLQLAALSMQGSDDVQEFVHSFTGSTRYIHDYLTDEVLLRQSADVRDFLLKTSILNHLNGPLCDAVRLGGSQGKGSSPQRNKAMSGKDNSTSDLDQPKIYHIRIKGHLDSEWSGWFEGLTIKMEEDGNPLLSGPVVDGAASPINPSDLATLDGEYGFKNPPPIVPGGEGSGKVVAVGPGPMGRYFLGKRVACLSQGKGSGMWADFDQQLHDACHQADAHLAFDAVAGSMTLQLLDALPEHSKVTVYRCLSYEAAQAGADHLIFEDKSVDGFWMGPWINNMNLVEILMLWRRAQKLMGTELKSEIRAQYPLQEAQKAVQDYLSQMTGGKILLCPDH